MPIIANYSITAGEDASLTLSLAPPANVGGWSVEFVTKRRLDGISGLITLSASSGFQGTSGITTVDSGAGRFKLQFGSAMTSGLDPGVYAMQMMRTDSGSYSVLLQGGFIVLPSV